MLSSDDGDTLWKFDLPQLARSVQKWVDAPRSTARLALDGVDPDAQT
jgi:hypothetical protein